MKVKREATPDELTLRQEGCRLFAWRSVDEFTGVRIAHRAKGGGEEYLTIMLSRRNVGRLRKWLDEQAEQQDSES